MNVSIINISRCDYVPVVDLESSEYPNLASLYLNIDIFVKSDKVEEKSCKYFSVMFAESGGFSSPS